MVMATFWDYAARINARRVLLWVCVACIAALVGVWIRTQSTNPDPASIQQLDRPARESTTEPMVDNPSALDLPPPTDNPFASRFLHELVERSEQARKKKEAARKKPPPVKVAKAEPPPAKKKPPRPEARLLYRGMLTRPDGTVLALVENQRTKHTAFFMIGSRIEGLTIDAISRESVELHQGDSVHVTLHTGESTSFQPGK